MTKSTIISGLGLRVHGDRESQVIRRTDLYLVLAVLLSAGIGKLGYGKAVGSRATRPPALMTGVAHVF